MPGHNDRWRHYCCPTCSGPVKLERLGSNSERDPSRYEFDGVDLSPEDCALLASIILHDTPRIDGELVGPNVRGIFAKLLARSREPRQPGRLYE